MRILDNILFISQDEYRSMFSMVILLGITASTIKYGISFNIHLRASAYIV